MCRPVIAAIAASVVLSSTAFDVDAQDLNPNIANSESVYFSNGDQKVLLETLAGKYCLAHAGLADERDRVAMLAALAHYTPLGSRIAAPDVMRVAAGAERHGPRPRPEAGLPWAYLEHVYSAASTGAEAADADLDLVFELTRDLGRQEAALDRQLYGAQGGTTLGLPLSMDILNQLYGAQVLAGQKLAKEMCGAAAGVGAADKGMLRVGHLARQLDRTMTAIVLGAPGAGISSPPTDDVRIALRNAEQAWGEVRDIVLTAQAAGGISPDDMTSAARALDMFSSHMEAAQQHLLVAAGGTT